jgi:hypothetical protein
MKNAGSTELSQEFQAPTLLNESEIDLVAGGNFWSTVGYIAAGALIGVAVVATAGAAAVAAGIVVEGLGTAAAVVGTAGAGVGAAAAASH